ncbi:MAG: Chloride channel protein [Burkholderiaceae bacterium]|jgi:CIC family chloride channel protein|nr:MAG: Chloride channel protein [Burkholderiaceae bacterium]
MATDAADGAPTPVLWFFALIAGVLAAIATSGFRALIAGVEWLSTGQTGSLVEAARHLSPWHRVLIGAAGGLLAGLVLMWGRRWAARGPQGTEHIDYIEAARKGVVDLNNRTTIVRSLSALLSVGSGASIGREGAMVQLSSWFGALLAKVAPLSKAQRDVILICGIAAGIGSAYHAPVAGVVFVLELALGFLSAQMIAPVMIASATAGLLNYGIDPAPLYATPVIGLLPAGLGMSLVVGLVCGGLGWAMLALVDWFRSTFRRMASLPLRLGLGGLLVGSLSALVPEVWGNGYSTISHLLQGQILWPWVVAILVTKFFATLLSTGSGAIGGMFTPTLFVGATTGFSLAEFASYWLPPEWVTDPRTLAVVGMSAMLSAVTHAPLMAIVMVLEMTNQFQLTVPVMLACGVAHAISTQFGTKPMYGNPIEVQH